MSRCEAVPLILASSAMAWLRTAARACQPATDLARDAAWQNPPTWSTSGRRAPISQAGVATASAITPAQGWPSAAPALQPQSAFASTGEPTRDPMQGEPISGRGRSPTITLGGNASPVRRSCGAPRNGLHVSPAGAQPASIAMRPASLRRIISFPSLRRTIRARSRPTWCRLAPPVTAPRAIAALSPGSATLCAWRASWKALRPSNPNWRAKIRQTLQRIGAQRVGPGQWSLAHV